MQLGAAGRSARLALPAGVALSRAALDAALVEAAVAAGAAFLPETAGSLEAVTSEGRTVALRQGPDEAAITARVVLAANGLKGALRGQPAEMQAHVEAGSRIGAGVLVEQGPAEYVAGTVYMAVGAKGYVGLVRVEDGRLNIAAAFDAGFVRRAGGPGPAAIQVLHEARFPAIAELAALPWKGTPPLTRQAPSPAAVRLFLLGDAAGYVEPFTGEGISWALATGQAVVPLALRALDRWQAELAADWSARLREIVGRRQRACRILAALLRRPLLSRLAIRLLEVAPQLANPLVRRLQG
jgi:flavin-dependent dehydrogenase